MDPIEIILIIIGIIIIVISCNLVDRTSNKNAGPVTLSNDHPIVEEQLQQLKEKMNHILSEISEDTVVRTDDNLSKISNEKIIAVNEFSEQILEKIKRNHEEVVFLYHMLSDKEKELKEAVREIDNSKKKIRDIMESKKENENVQSMKKSAPSQGATKSVVPVQNLKQDTPVQKLSEDVSSVVAINSLSTNSNAEILTLYSQGKSVIEISKFLGLGQGEVKLVIDLFKGKK